MSYPYNSTQHRLNEFVPTYVPHSDFIPTNQVIDSRQPEAQEVLRQYQLEKQKGRVFSQRPADFDPRRYVSIRTYENVNVGQPIPENQFQQYLKK